MTLCKKLKDSVEITTGGNAYNGDYVTQNATTDPSYSYYRDPSPDHDLHFTVYPTGKGDAEFETFHITVMFGGSNVGIWYNQGVLNNINLRNLPAAKLPEWEEYWNANRATLNAMATEFWNNVQ